MAAPVKKEISREFCFIPVADTEKGRTLVRWGDVLFMPNTSTLWADETRNRQTLERIPAGRWGDAGNLSGAVVFLSSPAGDYVQGHIMVVDGSWMARKIKRKISKKNGTKY